MVAGTRRSLVGALGLLSLLLCAPVAAQTGAGVDRTAAARALFEEGIAAADAGDWEAAADRFQRALTVRPSPPILFNFAGALIELGRLARASELLLRVAQDEAAEPSVREAAEARRAEVLVRLARLTVHLAPGIEDAEVTLDRRAIEPALLGVEVPVDPGAHTLALIVEGQSVHRREIQLAEGESRELTLRRALQVSDGAPRDLAASPWLWVGLLGGLAVVASAIGIAVFFATQGPAPYAGTGDPPTVFLGAP